MGKSENKTPQQNKKKAAAAATPTTHTTTTASSSRSIPENAQTAPFSYKFNRKTNTFTLLVTLSKVPHQYVSVDATDKHFYVDTFRWTRKLYLDMPYPEGVIVDSSQAEAEFRPGLLTVTFPIIHANPPPPSLQKKYEAKAGAKQAATHQSPAASPKNKKRKAERDVAPQLLETSTNGTAEGGADFQEPKKKVKKFAEKSHEFAILDAVNDVEEKKIDSKLQKEKAREQWEQQQEAAKLERRIEKLKKKEELLDKVISQQQTPVKPITKSPQGTPKAITPKRSVSFSPVVKTRAIAPRDKKGGPR